MSEEQLLREAAKAFGQDHVFTFWDALSDSERGSLLKNVKEIDFENIKDLLQVPEKRSPNIEERLVPPEEDICGSLVELRANDPALLKHYQRVALKAVHEGKLAVLLLAGGQGTRLGFHLPKGLFSPDLPSGRSLYQIQAEQLLRVQQLAQAEFGSAKPIPWYIMTSECTEETTVEFFLSHKCFGHSPENIIFFEQFTRPAFDFNGKILLEKKYKLSTAPDGNGGLYRALRQRHILEDMEARGVEYIQVYCVDNILVKLPDLDFVGFCLERSSDCAAEVVQKLEPTEPIGVVGMVDGRYRVVEYSEISCETAALRCSLDSTDEPQTALENGTGKQPRLVYSHGNICVHFLTRQFLHRVCQPEPLSTLKYHVAKKKVPFVNLVTGQQVIPTEANGIKFEQFVFDVFPFAENFAIWEVPRNERFSPLKNGPTASTDCPKTSRADYLAYHASLALAAGAILTTGSGCENDSENGDGGEAIIEISPLVSYAGENLECLKGRRLQGVNLLELDRESNQPVLRQLTMNQT
ncbi:UDP-N-acetylglucosamine/UDP-N-acetylgalactosamine diphosphorylase [Paragonimus westermani]|uniref:UDP-N-acetylglucosamine diphosphorylase n=1 Tax=Paragonimus westermani TaxID=34504 RepID=A0A5J4NXB2_9TREM|nr:UDP-N-acetylglucosamine/UDP-N-acetylgalactosamine diphosphorylase [Paragonimus westermani]